MKKLSLIIAGVGLISTATFATGHKNVFTIKQGVKKQEPAKATKAEAIKQEPIKATPFAKETTATKETKGNESKTENTSKEATKAPHRNLRAVPVKHETAVKENNSSAGQKK